MRDGIETLLFVFAILFAPIFVFDVSLNNGKLWKIVMENTFIDEAFYSFLRLLA